MLSSYTKAVVFCVFICFGLIPKASAVTVMGGQITWEQINSDSLLVTIDVLLDCQANSISNSDFFIESAGCKSFTFKTGKFYEFDITPTCDQGCSKCETGSCTTNYNYGFKKAVAKIIIPLATLRNTSCCNYTFYWLRCCRASIYTTGIRNQNSLISSVANICDTVNIESPKWKPLDVQLFRKGTKYEYDISVIEDADYDSIVYSLENPLRGLGMNVSWITNYNYDEPIRYLGAPKRRLKFPRGFNIDSSAGLIQFLPTHEDVSMFKYSAEYFRNGLFCGKIEREETVIISGQVKDKPPEISGYNCSASNADNFDIYACSGDTLEFDICLKDPDGDSVQYEWISNAKGCKIKVIERKADSKKLRFYWYVDSTAVRKKPYQLHITGYDNFCPLRNSTKQRFNIFVRKAKQAKVSYTNLGCGRVQAIVYVKNGGTFNKAKWIDPGFGIATKSKISRNADTNIFKFEKPGIIPFKLRCSDTVGCVAQLNDTARLKSEFLRTSKNFSDTTLCAFDSVELRVSVLGTAKPTKIIWSTGDTTSYVTTSKVKVTVPKPKFYNYYSASIATDSCTKYEDFFVNAHGLDITFIEEEYRICKKDTAIINPFAYHTKELHDSLTFFQWEVPIGSQNVLNDSVIYILDSGSFLLEMKDQYGCVYSDTGKVIFTNAEINISGDSVLCENSELLLVGNSTKQGGFVWYWLAKDSVLANSDSLKLVADRFYDLKFVFTDRQGCVEQKLFNVTPISIEKPFFSFDSTICEHDTFNATSSLDINNWVIKKDTFKNRRSIEIGNLNFTIDSSNQLEVYSYDTNGCESLSKLEFRVESKPQVTWKVPDSVEVESDFFIAAKGNDSLEYQILANALNWSFKSDSQSLSIHDVGIYEFILSAKNEFGCNSIDTHFLKVYSHTAIYELDELGFYVYPNPSSSLFIIENRAKGHLNAKIYSCENREVFSATFSNSIEVSNLTKGIYILVVEQNGLLKRMALIVQ